MKLRKGLTFLLSILLFFNMTYADSNINDGSAFITKAEFDSLKNAFQSQLDVFNTGIDSKIDNAIASYLSGIRLNREVTKNIIFRDVKKIKCITKTDDLSFTPKMPQISTIVWSVQNDNKGSSGEGSERDICMYEFYGNTTTGKAEKEKRYLLEDYDGATSGTVKYKWKGITKSALTTLSLFYQYSWGNPDCIGSHGNFYNAWPIETSLTGGIGSNKLSASAFKTANLNKNARLYLKRNDGSSSGNQYYTVMTPVTNTNVVSMTYNKDDGSSDIDTDYIITFSERNIIAGAYDHPEWVYTDDNSISGSTFVSNMTWTRRHKLSCSSYLNGIYSGARTLSYYNTSTRDKLCSFGIMPAISTNLIKLGEKTKVSIEGDVIKEAVLDENSINDGFPLLAENKGREITWTAEFEDDTKEYNLWFKMGPFATSHSGTGEPDETNCFEISHDDIKEKKVMVKDGKVTAKWKMPEDGVVYIKWSEADATPTGGGIINLEKCNTYIAVVEDK